MMLVMGSYNVEVVGSTELMEVKVTRGTRR